MFPQPSINTNTKTTENIQISLCVIYSVYVVAFGQYVNVVAVVNVAHLRQI